MPKAQPKAPSEVAYATWKDEKGMHAALSTLADGLARMPQGNSKANSFLGYGPNGESVRDAFTREDWERFRPQESRPQGHKATIRASMGAYDGCGIVRNTVDLMADFAVQGLGLAHHNKRTEAFYREWFRRVSGPERSERFLNLFYRCGQVIVKRLFSELPVRAVENFQKTAQAVETDIPHMEIDDPGTRIYPSRYVFLNPLTVEVDGEDLATFIGKEGFVYYISIPQEISRAVKNPHDEVQRKFSAALPTDLRRAIKSGQQRIPLDPKKLYVAHYKRDDWRTWATPMLTPILSDIQMLEKMKLADVAALDGVISCIRVWKLGSLDHKIIPPEAMFLRLARTLSGNVGGGVMDIVWGPDIELLETSTDAHHFLGEEKYKPCLAAIFQGLGIPPTLSGTAAAGYTNNYLSLKTLVERLEYGRTILKEFWEHEIRLVQKAMGFRSPASVTFDRLLTDEAEEKKLLLQLWDRHLVSDEAVREFFDLDPDIEDYRVRREERRRDSGVIPPRAGPYHDANHRNSLEKIYAQSGEVAPSQVGIELEPLAKGEEPAARRQEKQAEKQAKEQAAQQMEAQKMQLDHQLKSDKLLLQNKAHPNQVQIQQLKYKPTGVSGEGRPPMSKDSEKRKEKTVKPRTGTASLASTLLWATAAQKKVHELTSPAVLESLGRKTLRELTDEEARAFESLKACVLFSLPPESDFGEEEILAAMENEAALPATIAGSLKAFAAEKVSGSGKAPTLEESRQMQSACYALWHCNLDVLDEDETEDVAAQLILA